MVFKINSGWTNKEVVHLSGITLGQLRVLDRVDLIKPIRIGNPERPTLRYTWEQLVAIRAYVKLRQHCSLQALRETLEYLQLENPIQQIATKQLIACDNVVYWVNDDEREIGRIVSSKQRGQTVLISVILKGNELLEDLWKNGDGKIVDFAARAKEKPLTLVSA